MYFYFLREARHVGKLGMQPAGYKLTDADIAAEPNLLNFAMRLDAKQLADHPLLGGGPASPAPAAPTVSVAFTPPTITPSPAPSSAPVATPAAAEDKH